MNSLRAPRCVVYIHCSETIFGYKGLVVELYYSASTLATYVNVKYDEIIDPDDADGLKVIDFILFPVTMATHG